MLATYTSNHSCCKVKTIENGTLQNCGNIAKAMFTLACLKSGELFGWGTLRSGPLQFNNDNSNYYSQDDNCSSGQTDNSYYHNPRSKPGFRFLYVICKWVEIVHLWSGYNYHNLHLTTLQLWLNSLTGVITYQVQYLHWLWLYQCDLHQDVSCW